jgi:hypothetical protein
MTVASWQDRTLKALSNAIVNLDHPRTLRPPANRDSIISAVGRQLAETHMMWYDKLDCRNRASSSS